MKDEIHELNITENTPDVATEYNTNVAENVLRQQAQTPEEALKEAAEKIREMQ